MFNFHGPDTIVNKWKERQLYYYQEFVKQFEYHKLLPIIDRKYYTGPAGIKSLTASVPYIAISRGDLSRLLADYGNKIFNRSEISLETLAESLAKSGWYIRFYTSSSISIFSVSPDGDDKHYRAYKDITGGNNRENQNEIRFPGLQAYQDLADQLRYQANNNRIYGNWGLVDPQPAPAVAPPYNADIDILRDLENMIAGEEAAVANPLIEDLPINYEPRF